MEQLLTIAAAAESDGGVNPLFFVLGALALIVVSTLGPLSRLHERRDRARKEAAGTDAAGKDAAGKDAAGKDAPDRRTGTLMTGTPRALRSTSVAPTDPPHRLIRRTD